MSQLLRVWLGENKWPLLVMVALVIVFYGSLFVPNLKIYYTPDFGLSDIGNYHLPAKIELAESLKRFEIPFWNSYVGTGMSLFAEGQMGAFFVPNLILFFLFDPYVAWNLSFVVASLTTLAGVYVLIRCFGVSKAASLVGSVAFSFSAGVVVHFVNLPLVQAVSLMPWIFWIVLSLADNDDGWKKVFLSVLVMQQIMAGFLQIVFITGVGVLLVAIWKLALKDLNRRWLVSVGLSFLVGLMLSGPQIIPTINLIRTTARGVSSDEIFRFPYSIDNLVSFVNPEFLGSPKNGSYPPPSTAGIYWENTYYLGLIGLVFLVVSLMGRKSEQEKFWWAVAGVSLLISMGGNSPIRFIFELPGFSFFRVPSRFMILASLALAVLVAVGVDKGLKKVTRKDWHLVAVGLIFSVLVFDLFQFGWQYHPLVEAEKLKGLQEVGQSLEQSRIYTDDSYRRLWGEEMESNGWRNSDYFVELQKSMPANLNSSYGVQSVNYYGILIPERQYRLLADLNTMEKLRLVGVDKVLSFDELEVQGLNPSSEIDVGGVGEVYVYEVADSFDKYRLAEEVLVVDSMEEAEGRVNQGIGAGQVVVEGEWLESRSFAGGEVQVVEDQGDKVVLKVKAESAGLLVASDSYTPNWRARVNQKSVEVWPVNVNQKAVRVPDGESIVEFYYVPVGFYWGLVVFVLGLSGLFLFRRKELV